MVCSPLDCVGDGFVRTVVVVVLVVVEDLAGHDFAALYAVGVVAAGNSGNTLAIVGNGSDGSGNMGSVVVNFDIVVILYKVLAAIGACSNSVVCKVCMVKGHTTVHYGNNYVLVTGGIVLPNLFYVDVSTGLSVAFDDDGFLLFDGEYDDSTYPLVTATILTDEVYEKYLADNKDSDSFREDDGF